MKKVILFHKDDGIAIHSIKENIDEHAINMLIETINLCFQKLEIDFDFIVSSQVLGNHENGKLPDWNNTGINIDNFPQLDDRLL